MSEATISTKTFDAEGGRWFVQATIVLPDGTRYGAHCVELPEEATDDELSAAVLAQYEPPAEPAPTKRKR